MTDTEWQERMEALSTKYDAFRNVELFEDLVTEATPITTWAEFQAWFSSFKHKGCFRGHRDATWSLVTTFDRKITLTITAETDGKGITTIEKLNPESNEKALLREFQRAAHHYYTMTPALDRTVDWLALMQHHGAPTRMLDWTRSPYVALYFAMREDSESDAAVWAIDLDWLRQRSNELLRAHDTDCPDVPDCDALGEYTNRSLLKPDNPDIIVCASPLLLNERMLTQHGELLCNLRHGFAFSTILLGMLIRPSTVQRPVVSRIIVKRDRRIEFLEELRLMNIHETSLFPGLDGFARSLGVALDVLVAGQAEARKQDILKTMKRPRH